MKGLQHLDVPVVFLQPFQFADSCGRESADIVEETGSESDVCGPRVSKIPYFKVESGKPNHRLESLFFKTDKLDAAYPNAWDVYWMEDRTTADTFMLQTVFVDYMQHWTRAYFKTQYESPGAGCKYAHGDSERHQEPDLTKTALCRKMLSGEGCNDPKCTFAHSRDELRSTDDVYKTSMCTFFRYGRCQMGRNCRHAHFESELRQRKESSADLAGNEDEQSDLAACLKPGYFDLLYQEALKLLRQELPLKPFGAEPKAGTKDQPDHPNWADMTEEEDDDDFFDDSMWSRMSTMPAPASSSRDEVGLPSLPEERILRQVSTSDSLPEISSKPTQSRRKSKNLLKGANPSSTAGVLMGSPRYQNVQNMQGIANMLPAPQMGAFVQGLPIQQMPQQLPLQMQVQMPQQVGQQTLPQQMQQQQAQQMPQQQLPQQQMPQQQMPQQQMSQQQMQPQQMPQQQVPQQQMPQQQMPQQQMPQQQLLEQQLQQQQQQLQQQQLQQQQLQQQQLPQQQMAQQQQQQIPPQQQQQMPLQQMPQQLAQQMQTQQLLFLSSNVWKEWSGVVHTASHGNEILKRSRLPELAEGANEFLMMVNGGGYCPTMAIVVPVPVPVMVVPQGQGGNMVGDQGPTTAGAAARFIATGPSEDNMMRW
ncbi:hypothetical protein AK812_SmicGene10811 [Symbiodinium microadriaticum]|uniref:C3H1-type domain-containing protein n=1 Tax=Symbiodinium microadriaticum TaxID=2951 RepID=A0A1Q9EES3_SYMMI|nr:hypothetical protein AK812_SmicGene10811 [Symbiodinium microadriaticum]